MMMKEIKIMVALPTSYRRAELCKKSKKVSMVIAEEFLSYDAGNNK
jgi:hypothetical protein